MNLRRTILAITLGLGLLLGSIATPAQAWTNSAIAGHRGATGVAGYPEESTRAVAYAKTHGATIAEGDVLFTEDDEPIMIHDRTYDRTTDCTGPVSAKTFAEMRLCASSAVVPSVLTWMAHVKSHNLIANLEVRGNPLPTTRQLDKLIAQINLNFPRELVIASFDPAVLALMKTRLGDRAKYAPIVHARTSSGVESAFGYSVADHAAKYDILITDFSWLIVARVGWYHDAGMPVWCYKGASSSETQADYDRMRALNCDVMIVDDPAAP